MGASDERAVHWSRTLREVWGVEANLARLGGEVDENWSVDADEGYVFKVMHAGCSDELVRMQLAASAHCAARGMNAAVPRAIPDLQGQDLARVHDPEGHPRWAWLIRRLPGRVMASVRARSPEFDGRFGRALGELDDALADFDHPGLRRELKWDLQRAEWIGEHLHRFEGRRRSIVASIFDQLRHELVPGLAALPKQAIHNDVNDHNVLVSHDALGIIDFGDAIVAPRVCELAIAAAYLVLDRRRPFEALAACVAGYDAAIGLDDVELELVWPGVRARLAVSVVNSALAKIERPDDPYVVVSEAPAWRFLEDFGDAAPAFVTAKLRRACKRQASEQQGRVRRWLAAQRTRFQPAFAADLNDAAQLDLGVAGLDAPDNPLELDVPALQARVDLAAAGASAVLGRYAEARLIYGGRAFRSADHPASDRRTVHLGIDVFLPAGSEVHTPLPAIVHSVEVASERYDYGGVVTLRHDVEGHLFFTLWGHLDPEVAETLALGRELDAGEAFARLGNPAQNGGWPPHVHVQAGVFDHPASQWPGAADPDDAEAWQDVFFDPAPLLGLEPGMAQGEEPDRDEALRLRVDHGARNLKLSYAEPLMLVRGWRSYLFDAKGRTYLDAFNNVPHVGHAHPRLVAAAHEQSRLLNTNTRYVHPHWGAYARKLVSYLPEHLSVCFFLNSASEANELALRLARAHTGARDVVVSAHGYHGNTNAATDMSHYKFAGPGGGGQPDWVHVAPVPDVFRGEFGAEDADAGPKYAAAVADIAATLREGGRGLAGFISEPFPSVGGQLVPPPGYLSCVYEHVRAAGGLCIADEVQTGLGRLGEFFWGFEQQRALPDMVVLGKPIGNGHPLAALVTTRAIADALPEGVEFFSTFGGNPVSCAVGLELLHVLEDESLPANAARVGALVLEGVRALQSRHACIGDVRGMGFFMGVEMVEADGRPATSLARAVVNGLRRRRILIGSDGPHDNVLKIRPPMCFSVEDARHLLDGLGEVLDEFAEDAP